MSKVITFSRYFQKSHPKSGQPTNFHEQIFNSIGYDHVDYLKRKNPKLDIEILKPICDFDENITNKKHHTIRSGNRFKNGDFFSPRVWSSKPYCSPQIILANDILVKKTWDIIFVQKEKILNINGFSYSFMYESTIEKLAKNDGLSVDDFKAWFPKPFVGQIICWSDDVSY
jgi:hypothetical protein